MAASAHGAERKTDGRDYEQRFLSELDTIRAAIRTIARTHRLSVDEAEELASRVVIKLIERDYAVLRKFQGRSTLRTYLTVVIHRLFLDGRIAEQGRWRASVRAKREGATALLFEELTSRRGLSFDEACEWMQAARGIVVDRAELDRLAPHLQVRQPLRFVPIEDAPEIAAAPDAANNAVDTAIRATIARRTSHALAAELAALPPPDRSLLRRHFVQGHRIAQVARETTEDPKLLYRRLARLLATLRTRLERRGVTRLDIRELFAGPAIKVPDGRTGSS